MNYKKLSNTDTRVSSIGLGAMSLSLANRPSENVGISVIHRALDLGVNLIDTADSYCIDEADKHHNERLIAKALSTYKGSMNKDNVIVATKGGLMRPNGDWIVNCEPNHLRKTIKESYEALGGMKPIPLWQLHAIDPNYSIEESFEVVREAVDKGLIKYVGVSNFNVEEIQRANRIVPIVSVQNQFNPWCRVSEKNGVLEYCEKNGIIFLPWSPVGGMHRYKKLLEIKPLVDLACKKSCSVYALVLAWIRLKSPCVVPIPGANRISSIESSVDSLKINISQEEIFFIDYISDNLQWK